jgi:hypothetical protein
VPDSLVALVIVAFIGVPGWVYVQLAGAPQDGGAHDSTELSKSIEFVFFGMTCTLAGALLSMKVVSDDWDDVVSAQLGLMEKTQVQGALTAAVPEIGLVTLLFAMIAALFLAGLVRFGRSVSSWIRKRSAKPAGSAVSSWKVGPAMIAGAIALGIAVALAKRWFIAS